MQWLRVVTSVLVAVALVVQFQAEPIAAAKKCKRDQATCTRGLFYCGRTLTTMKEHSGGLRRFTRDTLYFCGAAGPSAHQKCATKCVDGGVAKENKSFFFDCCCCI